MNMPMSRCRHCGKFVPNIYHKDHEMSLCRVMRGLDKRGPQEPLPPKDDAQRQLSQFTNKGEEDE